MGKVLNLNHYRKLRERREREAKAAANRAKYGQPKPETARLQLESERDQAELDDKLLEDKSNRDGTPDVS